MHNAAAVVDWKIARARKSAATRNGRAPARFLARVEQTSGCWIWRGNVRVRGGYGRLGYCGRPQLAHRVAYQIFVGPIPEGMDVCHRCDNPPCVRPDHLFVGTALDNIKDSIKKGRYMEARRLVGLRLRGRTVSTETRAKLSAIRLGKPGWRPTPEQRRAKSAILRALFAGRRAEAQFVRAHEKAEAWRAT